MNNLELISYIKSAGELLFGARWQTDLSVELGLSDARRMRQWVSGERNIPPGVVNDVNELLTVRKNKIESFLSNSVI
jgi:hypothetical protein